MNRKIWGEWTVWHFVFLAFLLGVTAGAALAAVGRSL
jgi:hypothetical protein